MNRIDRLFGILTLLQSRKYVSAESIAERYNISIRTVYRDIKAIGEQGVPVSFEPQRGYFIVNGYFLPPVAFNTDEANALLLMESLVKGFTDRSIQKHYASALLKVKNVLKQPQKDQLDHLKENIKLQLPATYSHDFDHLSVIQQAITEKAIIEIDYKKSEDESGKRKVEPVGIIFYAFHWHLIAWCHFRADYRDFRVSRINSIRNTGQPFIKQHDLDLNEYMELLPVNY